MSRQARTAAAVGVISGAMAWHTATGQDRAELERAIEALQEDLFADGPEAAVTTMALLVETTLVMASVLSGRPASVLWPAVAQMMHRMAR